MTTNKPYKIEISWNGTYTSGVFSGDFIDITDLIYENNLTIVRERDNENIAIIRNSLNGDFILYGDLYDDLIDVIDAGLPEIIIKISLKYSGSWHETIRVASETRPVDMDSNRKFAKISKFKTIDEYTDILSNVLNKKIIHEFGVYDYNEGAYFDNSGTDKYLRYADMLYKSPIANSFNSVDFGLGSDRKYSDSIWGLFPGYKSSSIFYNFGYNNTSSGNEPIGLFLSCPTTPVDLTFTLQDILNIYKTMFNLHWFIDEYSPGVNAVMLKFPKDVFYSYAYHYEDESQDFQKYKYTQSNYNKFEYFKVSENNLTEEHVNRPYKYDVINDIAAEFGNDKIVTDFIYSTDPTNTDWTKRDMLFFLGKTDATPIQIEIESGAGTINPSNTIINYKCSLAYRLKNYLNDFRQMNNARIPNIPIILNPNIAGFQFEQEPFYIEFTLLNNFRFDYIVETSLGSMRTKSLTYNLKNGTYSLICVK